MVMKRREGKMRQPHKSPRHHVEIVGRGVYLRILEGAAFVAGLLDGMEGFDGEGATVTGKATVSDLLECLADAFSEQVGADANTRSGPEDTLFERVPE